MLYLGPCCNLEQIKELFCINTYKKKSCFASDQYLFGTTVIGNGTQLSLVCDRLAHSNASNGSVQLDCLDTE